MIALPADVKKALLAVLADKEPHTKVRELLGIEESERDIMQRKEIVEAEQIKLTRAELGSPANIRWLGVRGGGLYPPPRLSTFRTNRRSEKYVAAIESLQQEDCNAILKFS